MRISLLQPAIIRGDIDHNARAIQQLIDKSNGELLVLPEYALTGSLVLDRGADPRDWARKSARAAAHLSIPAGKYLLLNSLVELQGVLYNSCTLWPTQERYSKLFPDETERQAGILPGPGQKVFELLGKRFKVVICYDLPHMDQIPTEGLDFLLFIYHFTRDNVSRVLEEVKQISAARNLRVLASSLVSDANNGFSSFIEGRTVISLPERAGILEVELE